MNGVHDMGGMQDMGPVELEPNEPVFHHSWEGRVFALRRAMGAWRKWNIDAMRYAVELVPPIEYLRSSYYERQLIAFFEVLVPPRFHVGETVRARNINPTGHTRLPRDARAKLGVVERDHGVFVFPDTNAVFQGEDPQHLYSVCFTARELWGDHALPKDSVYLNLWESYLAPA